MFCEYINPETNRLYVDDYACCNNDNICPMINRCIEEHIEYSEEICPDHWTIEELKIEIVKTDDNI